MVGVEHQQPAGETNVAARPWVEAAPSLGVQGTALRAASWAISSCSVIECIWVCVPQTSSHGQQPPWLVPDGILPYLLPRTPCQQPCQFYLFNYSPSTRFMSHVLSRAFIISHLMLSGLPTSRLAQGFSNSSMNQSHLEDSFIHRLLGPTPRATDSLGLGWGLRTSFEVM